jgi:hypothetical protein
MIKIGAFDEALEHGLVPGFIQLTFGESEEPVIDSGATHHLTANRYALRNFRLFPNPIPLRVATKSGASYITGAGDLSFPTQNGQITTLKGV